MRRAERGQPCTVLASVPGEKRSDLDVMLSLLIAQTSVMRPPWSKSLAGEVMPDLSAPGSGRAAQRDTGDTHWRGVNPPMTWGTRPGGVLWKQTPVSTRRTHGRVTHEHVPREGGGLGEDGEAEDEEDEELPGVEDVPRAGGSPRHFPVPCVARPSPPQAGRCRRPLRREG